jgi:hypothetical protein
MTISHSETKSYALSDEDFRARIAAFNREGMEHRSRPSPNGQGSTAGSACKRRSGAQAYTRSVISSRQLNWRRNGEGLALHFERRLTALLHIVRDDTYAGMWRVKFADGSLSDMANVTRAKDAGRAHGLAALNRKLDCQETAKPASPIRQNEVGATL